MGDVATHIRLLIVLDAYEVAQRAAEIVPIRGQEDKADRLYAELTEVAIAVGFKPGREHRGLTTYEFAQKHADLVRRTFPNHVKEARRAA